MTDSVGQTIRGYRRATGWGIRNHVLVLPARTAANVAASRIAAAAPPAVAVAHEWDDPPGDPDRARVARTLAGFASSPNVGATLIVGVFPDDRRLADEVAARGQQVEFVALADHGGTNATVAFATDLVRHLVGEVSTHVPVPMPVSELMLGLECGGSDAWSGVTANPALGVASDLLVAAGGTSILAETTELIGAEHLLAARAADPAVGARLIEVVHAFESELAALGVDIRGAQPAPGNIEGGLSTIEEKSLGSVEKSGTAPLQGVLEFADRPSGRGLYFMDTPGQDIEQMVGMVAGGCQIIAFTTGRGTPTGSPIAPCVKIGSNSPTSMRQAGDIDIDAGPILDGRETVATMGRRIFDLLLEVANGRSTVSEVREQRDFAISRTLHEAI